MSQIRPIPPAGEFAVPEVFKAVIAASNALARLDEIAELLENADVFINAIPVLEARASCDIENVVTTHDAIFSADVSSTNVDQNTISAIRLRRALLAGTKVAKQRGITTKLATKICTDLMGRQMSLRTQPGTVIRSGVKTVYTPPAPNQLERLMSSWEKFANRDDLLHPTVVMALSHYQFEAIHPFSDGNGRTGRVLNVLQLVSAGLLQYPILHLSKYLNDHRDDYYKHLRAVDQNGAWVEWVLFMLEAVRFSAVDSANKLKSITELQLRFGEKFAVRPDLADLIFEKPYLQIRQVVERCGVTRLTASNWLSSLEQQGALKCFQSRREKFFVNHQLVRLLAS